MSGSDTANMRGNHGRGGAMGSGSRALSHGLWRKKALGNGEMTGLNLFSKDAKYGSEWRKCRGRENMKLPK